MNYQTESWMAWRDHLPKQNRNLRRVIDSLLRSGSGMTCDEIEVETTMSHQSCSATITHACRRGLLIKSGLRRPTRTGSLAMVHVLAATPEEATDVSKPEPDGTVETIRCPEASRTESKTNNARQSEQGLEHPARSTPHPDSEAGSVADFHRRQGLRKNSDGSQPDSPSLFG